MGPVLEKSRPIWNRSSIGVNNLARWSRHQSADAPSEILFVVDLSYQISMWMVGPDEQSGRDIVFLTEDGQMKGYSKRGGEANQTGSYLDLLHSESGLQE